LFLDMSKLAAAIAGLAMLVDPAEANLTKCQVVALAKAAGEFRLPLCYRTLGWGKGVA
jgi:hypothetical protein